MSIVKNLITIGALFCVLWPSSLVFAQQTQQAYTGDFPIALDATTARDFNQHPLGLAHCKEGLPVRIKWDATALSYSSVPNMRVFLRADTDCKNAILNSSTQIGSYLYNGLLSGTGSLETTPGAKQGFFPQYAPDAAQLSTQNIIQFTNFVRLKADEKAPPSACEQEKPKTAYALCIAIDNPNGSVSSAGGSSASTPYVSTFYFYIDTQPPKAPVQVSATAGDESAEVKFESSDNDIAFFNIRAENIADSNNIITKQVQGTLKSYKLTGLTNGQTYKISVSAQDFADNIGPENVILDNITATDQCDFWECYRGQEKGGFCFISTAAYGSYDHQFVRVFRAFRDSILFKFKPGISLSIWYYEHGADMALAMQATPWSKPIAALLLMIPYLGIYPSMRLAPGGFLVFVLAYVCLLSVVYICIVRRLFYFNIKKSIRKILPITAGVFIYTFLPTWAYGQAQADYKSLYQSKERFEKPRPRIGLHLNFGTYRPHIDSDPQAQGVYALYFGNSSAAMTGAGRKLRAEGTLDVYLYRKIGLLGISGSFGFWQASARTLTCGTGCTIDSSTDATKLKQGTDQTRFLMFPLALSLVYKFDYLFERYKVPLIPYARFGLDCYFWRIDGAGHLAYKTGVNGQKNYAHGATFGIHLNPGLAFKLDFLDRAGHLANIGFYGIYLNFEWILNKVNNFGSSRSWDLSDQSFLAGLSVDF